MDSTKTSRSIADDYVNLFRLADELQDACRSILEEFNTRRTKLFDLVAHQRIFLFIFTRALKTYSSILELCKQGFGQDVAVLIRSLLENLITAKYIIRRPKTAKELAERFVAYKWVIFKRHLPEQERSFLHAPPEKRAEFEKHKRLILEKVDEFKKKFHVTSDRGLLTWSGKTVRDMARDLGREWQEEYDETFRLCSRFSHPSILGDQEYMIQDGNHLTFSPLPSKLGVRTNLRHALHFYLEFLVTVDELFELKHGDRLNDLRRRFSEIQKNESAPEELAPSRPSASTPPIRECTVVFKTR